MSKTNTNQSSEKLFNISKEYKKHYKLGHSSPSKDAGIPVYSKSVQVYRNENGKPTKTLVPSFY